MLFSSLLYLNISLVVAFQRWWVLKSKLFAKKSTCSKEILIFISLNHLSMIFCSRSNKGWLSWFSMWKIWNTVWIRCWGNCPQRLGFWNFFGFFFQFFPLKIVYFWIKSRKNIYGWFFHSICATELKFGTKNNVRINIKNSDFC